MVYFLVQADILFGFLKTASPPYGYIIAAFAAGFSETLVPNTIAKLEKAEDRQTEKNITAESRGRAGIKQQHSIPSSAKKGTLVPAETISTLPDSKRSRDNPSVE